MFESSEHLQHLVHIYATWIKYRKMTDKILVLPNFETKFQNKEATP
jgi:hypothetical protein